MHCAAKLLPHVRQQPTLQEWPQGGADGVVNEPAVLDDLAKICRLVVHRVESAVVETSRLRKRNLAQMADFFLRHQA